jgi:carbamoyltransferase
MANFVFDSPEAEGKLMGLAAYSPSLPKLQTTLNHFDFLKSIDLTKSASMQKYKTWEENPNKDYYLQLARFTQDYFEQNIFNFLNEAKQKFPNIDNLILTGGCALNCTANAKILHSKLFNHIYVTPNPSDTSISLGCAYGISQIKEERIWSPLQHQHQIAYLGAKSSVPENYNILKLFQDFEIEQCFDICKFTATLLAQNKIIAWFQGRSECGPRALGNRSILAIPTIPNLRDYLNNKIKFRESFRPYGCSVPWEDSHLYFECSPGFNNPFMSFATPLRSSFQDILKEVAHVDNTSRMQTVRKEQNLLFHTLLKEIQILTNIPILLNTSLNVMNEPILETPIDALRFLKNSTIDGLAIGNFYIYNKKK